MKRKKYKIIPFLLLFALIFSSVSNNLWYHTHILADGRIVSHSHFYFKTEEQAARKIPISANHNHTKAEFLILHLFTVINFTIIGFFILVAINRKLKFIFNFTKEIFHRQKVNTIFSLRGPPALV